MRLPASLAASLLALTTVASCSPARSNRAATDGSADVGITDRETLDEAAVHARELLAYRSDGIGTLASVFPTDYPDASLAGLSIALQEYFAVYPNGDLVLLAMPISKVFHNALVIPNRNISFTVKDELAEREKGKMWAADRRRVAIWGTLKRLDGKEAAEAKKLYDTEHPDAPFWDGPHGPHFSYWVRYEVSKVYYFGGFGDHAAIGFLDMDLYRSSIPKAPLRPVETVIDFVASHMRKGKAFHAAVEDKEEDGIVFQRKQ